MLSDEVTAGLLDNTAIPVLEQNNLLTDTKTNHLKDEDN
jgi:hypothetical protein